MQGAPIDWDGMKVYPSDDRWGNRLLPAYALDHGQGDRDDCLVVTLMDVWVLTSAALAELRLASWVPVDHDPAPPRVLDFFERTGARPVAMSRFGEGKLRDRGLDPLYVPHGVDTKVLRPRRTGGQVRELMGIPRDAFVVGMVAANKGLNPPRKAFPQVFQAFAQLRREHDDAYLYLHTELSGAHDGMNLGALAAACGIPTDRIKTTPPWRYEMGVGPEDLSHLYSAMDVLANPSYGEGFGVPIVEALACGVPVIVTDCSAMTELCGAGWLVDGDRWYDATQGAFFKCPAVGDVLDAMRQAYDKRGDETLRERARAFALGYDADVVTETYWKPALKALEEQTPRPARRTLANEPWLTRYLPERGRVAIDVGANVGNVTEHLLDGFDEVHAFEPHPEAYRQLAQRVGRRAVTHELAVGAHVGDLTLKLYDAHEHTSAFDDDELDTLTRGEPRGEITVGLVTLDSLGFDRQPVDFVKVDTEGFEYSVLLGAVATLRHNMPAVLVEVHRAHNGALCEEFLRDLGYDVERVPHPHACVPGGHHWLHATAPAAAEAEADMVGALADE